MTVATNIEKLLPFCDADKFARYALATPWYTSGYAVATDGRIAAWLPSDPFDAPCDGRRPQIEPLMRKPLGLNYRPLGELPARTNCPDCNGLGYTIEEKCEECDGTGEVEHDCDCPHCEEETEECIECGGLGKFTGDDAKVKCDCRYEPFEIGGLTFALEYLLKIAALGDSQIAVDDRLWFKCGEICGTLMPIDPRFLRAKKFS